MKIALLFLIALFLLQTQTAFVQTAPNPADYDITKCKTLEEVNAAKAAGKEMIEIRGSYMFKTSNGYSPLYPSLRRALDERHKLGMSSNTASSSPQPTSNMVFNPLSIIYPFTEIAEDQTVKFEIEDGSKIESSKVMLHAEPYSFDEITFGPLNFRQKGLYFAVTGHFVAEAAVKDPTAQLEYHVGSAVVSKEGDVLWKHYGKVDKTQGFHSLAQVENTTNEPQYLLVFLLAKGKLDKQLARIENFPVIDAKPFDYHVLSSIALDISPNWFPPLDEIAKEEYLKLYREEQQKRAANPLPNRPITPTGK